MVKILKQSPPNNPIHLTEKNITPFAITKALTLFTSSDWGIMLVKQKQTSFLVHRLMK